MIIVRIFAGSCVVCGRICGAQTLGRDRSNKRFTEHDEFVERPEIRAEQSSITEENQRRRMPRKRMSCESNEREAKNEGKETRAKGGRGKAK
jgi:hypothetical protein